LHQGNLDIPYERDNSTRTVNFQRRSPTYEAHHFALALTVAFTSIALGQMTQAPQKHEMVDSKKEEMSLYPTAEIQWKDGPASLPAGARFAVLEGDPSKEGFFTMRLWLPDGFKISPHWHPKVEHVTVISGTFNLGMGKVRSNGDPANARWDLWFLARGNEAFRVGERRDGPSTSWHRPMDDHLRESVR